MQHIRYSLNRGMDSVKSTVTVWRRVTSLRRKGGGGFDWRGCFQLEDTTFCG